MLQKLGLERPTTFHKELSLDLGPGHLIPDPGGVLADIVTDLPGQNVPDTI